MYELKVKLEVFKQFYRMFKQFYRIFKQFYRILKYAICEIMPKIHDMMCFDVTKLYLTSSRKCITDVPRWQKILCEIYITCCFNYATFKMSSKQDFLTPIK